MLTHGDQPWKRFLCHAKIVPTLVVFTQHVVFGLKLFDVFRFENDCLKHRVGFDPLDVFHFVNETFNRPGRFLSGEVTANARAKVSRFANVNQGPLPVVKEIDAGSGGSESDFFRALRLSREKVFPGGLFYFNTSKGRWKQWITYQTCLKAWERWRDFFFSRRLFMNCAFPVIF